MFRILARRYCLRYRRAGQVEVTSNVVHLPTFAGYAVDGFGIYVERNAKGQLLTNSSLDKCHGRVSKVQRNGTSQSIFHYVATLEYPYTIGCFEGSTSASNALVF